MKMKNTSDKEKFRTLLREYVEIMILTEDDGGGDGGGYDGFGAYGEGMGSTGGWGKFFGSIANVGAVAVGKSKEMLQVLKTGIAVTIEAAVSSLIPFFEAEYKTIFEKHRNQLNQIKQRYDAVYKKSSEALRGGDAQLIMFMTNPTAFLTGPVLQKAPDVALDTLDVLTGGKIPPEKLKKAKSLAKTLAVATTAGSVMQNSSFRRNDNFLLKEGKKQKFKDQLKKFIEDATRKYIQPEYKNATSDANKVLKSFGQQVTEMVNGITFDKLPPELKSKFKIKEDEVKNVAQKQKKDPEQVKKEMLDTFLMQVKEKILTHYKQKVGKDFNAAAKEN